MNRLLAASLFAAFIGCSDDEVKTAQVLKPADASLRTIAVIVPRTDATWFFKLSGPAPAVTSDEPAFRKFVESVKFTTGDPPVSWSMPEGWSSVPAKKERFATLRTASGVEATVTNLGPNQDVLKNVNRWRGQIALPPIDEAGLAKITGKTKVGDVEFTWVDMISRGPAPVPITPSRSSPKDASGTATKLAYQTPSGWEARPANSVPFAAVVFRAGSGDDAVDVSVSPLGGGAGGLAQNVNRWRSQIGLPAQDEKQIQASAKELTIEDKPARYFDLIGPEGTNRKRILGVIAERGPTTWFIKVRGTAEAVARQQAAFESFAKSLKLPSEANGE